jgi:hypothetical protein
MDLETMLGLISEVSISLDYYCDDAQLEKSKLALDRIEAEVRGELPKDDRFPEATDAIIKSQGEAEDGD